jgi:multidrug transporter EmrE-like cation transporter
MTYVYIAITIIFSVAGQLMLKHATNYLGEMPDNLRDGAVFLLRALIDLYVIGGFLFAFIASVAWIGAVSKMELSFVYPFTSLNFVLVLIFSALLFQEQINASRVIGILAICIGVYFISRG